MKCQKQNPSDKHSWLAKFDNSPAGLGKVLNISVPINESLDSQSMAIEYSLGQNIPMIFRVTETPKLQIAV